MVHLATVAGNEAGYGGGLGFVQTGNGRGWLFLHSVVLALNSGVTAPEDDLWLEEVGTNFVWAEAEDSDIQTVTQWGGASYTPEPTVIDINPGFADPVAGNYHLTPYSPVLDLGSCHPRSPFDCDGEPRPFGADCDMGADEYAGGWRPPLDLWITKERLDGLHLREACRSILVGPAVVVESGSAVELRASASVSFDDGFEVASGGGLTVRNYFNPVCLVPFP